MALHLGSKVYWVQATIRPRVRTEKDGKATWEWGPTRRRRIPSTVRRVRGDHFGARVEIVTEGDETYTVSKYTLDKRS